MNLLAETIEALTQRGYTSADVLWVGSRGGCHAITWSEFVRVADSEYDAGYGAQEIATDLVVVGADWWLERQEYHGAEWWGFQRQPQKGDTPASFDVVNVRDVDAVGWESIASLKARG